MRYSENALMPYLQPIVAVDDGKIYGYEVLGRYTENGIVNSLGGFFGDESISQSEKAEVDRVIRKKGMEQFAEAAEENQYIFINMRICWLDAYADNPDEMPTLKMARELGIKFENLVMEISEHDFSQLGGRFSIPIAYYKSLGIRIAVDDYGAENSCISRVAELSPDFVKVDMDIVHKSEQFHQYRAYLRCITDLCDTLGIEVIYEGMENIAQLRNCINSGGRFYQGFLLAKPVPDIKSCAVNSNYISECLFNFILSRAESNRRTQAITSELDEFTERLINTGIERLPREALDRRIRETEKYAPNGVVRVFLCNKYGFQISSNVGFGNGAEIDDAYNKNWAWRSYFKNALRHIANTGKSYISQSYLDITKKSPIYTYVRSIGRSVYIFVDIESGAIGKSTEQK